MEKMEQQTAHLRNMVKENADNLRLDFKEQTGKMSEMFTTMCGVLNQTKQQYNSQQMNNIHVPNLQIVYPYYQAQQMVTQEQYNTTTFNQRISGCNHQTVNTANSNIGSFVSHAKAVSNRGA
eukprot:9637934-Ditylum_brightwellii.AAC.1